MRFKPGKIGLRILIGIAILLIAIFFSVSPVAKYLIEKHSKEWTGRQITMKGLFINLLNLDVTVKGLCVYESDGKSEFFSCSRIHTELSMFRLLRSEFRLTEVQLISPVFVIVQDGSKFNFDDLVKRFVTPDTTSKKPMTPSEPVKYTVEAISIFGGTITYRDKAINQEVVMNHFDFGCPLLAWNSNKLRATARFSLKSGGLVKGVLILNTDTLGYTLRASVDRLNLEFLQPYMKDYLKTSYAGGLLSSQLEICGDFDKPEAVALKGDISLSDFRLDDMAKKPVASWSKFAIHIDSLDVASDIFRFGEISLDNPYLFVEMFDKGDNFSNMMAPSSGEASGSTSVDSINYSNPFTMMAGYIKEISRDYIISNYTASNSVIRNGHIIYNDYTLEDKFTYELEELALKSGRIDSKSDSLAFDFSCLANRSGRMKAHMAFDPRDYKNMAVNYSVDNMRISDFNPYSKFYVAHAFVEGKLFYASTNRIYDGQLKSTNILSIKQIEVTKRLPGIKGLYNLPLRLAIAILRDRKGNIDLDIPVEGDLNDPTYKLGKVIWKILGNLVTKAATAPFDLLAKALGANEDELKLIRFDYLQKSFDSRQFKSLDLVEKSLTSKPELKVKLVQVASKENEKELQALTEAKRKYYLERVIHIQKDSLSAEELKAVAAIANKDSVFSAWLDSKLLPEVTTTLPTQLKSRKLLGEELLNQQVETLFANRNRLVTDYLVNIKHLDPARIIVSNTTDEKAAQFESSPRFTVEFVVDE